MLLLNQEVRWELRKSMSCRQYGKSKMNIAYVDKYQNYFTNESIVEY